MSHAYQPTPHNHRGPSPRQKPKPRRQHAYAEPAFDESSTYNINARPICDEEPTYDECPVSRRYRRGGAASNVGQTTHSESQGSAYGLREPTYSRESTYGRAAPYGQSPPESYSNQRSSYNRGYIYSQSSPQSPGTFDQPAPPSRGNVTSCYGGTAVRRGRGAHPEANRASSAGRPFRTAKPPRTFNQKREPSPDGSVVGSDDSADASTGTEQEPQDPEPEALSDAQDRGASPNPSPRTTYYARPRFLVHRDELVAVDPNPDVPCRPYIAISYTWDPDPDAPRVEKWGRRVTLQALDIVRRLARRTSSAMWIDAICIAQDDDEAKEAELPRMADIYRGAAAVWCLLPSVDDKMCRAVRRCAAFVDDGSLASLTQSGSGHLVDTVLRMGLIGTGIDRLADLFAERWWRRAWTFQEAILNPCTLLVGGEFDCVAIAEVLKVAPVMKEIMAHRHDKTFLERPLSFWDAMLAQDASVGCQLDLGQAIASVWRRDATVAHDLVYSLLGACGLAESVKPSYHKPFDNVLSELFNAAARAGDYSWIPWCCEMDHDRSPPGMSLVPTPQLVKELSSALVNTWTTAPGLPGLDRCDTPPCGILVPLRKVDSVETRTDPLTLRETVEHLRQLGYGADGVWDMLFDITVALEDAAIMDAVLELALSSIYAQQRTGDVWSVTGKMPETAHRTAFMQYGHAARKAWFRRRLRGGDRLVVISCAAGETVIRAEEAIGVGADAAVFALPVVPKAEGAARDLVILSGAAKAAVRACATSVLVKKSGVRVVDAEIWGLWLSNTEGPHAQQSPAQNDA
ncbi:heterokaryon incompatibility protein-domain-containing protein [Trametes meyenii]|nr:heterokaryon incompatibility protein-domain-containing protein [Trametes meyenii]